MARTGIGRWQRIARSFYILATVTAVVFGLLLGQFHHQLDGFRQQIQQIEQQMEGIRHQQCMDANQALRQWEAQVHDPTVVYRKCGP